MDNFGESWGWFAGQVHDLACTKGWWEEDRSFLECMGLVISELGEAVEAFRSPKCSCKILAHSHAAEELADVIIRLADMCQYFDIDPWEHHRGKPKAELFDHCSMGTDEDNFVFCLDVMMEYSPHLYLPPPSNPIEYLALIAAYLGEAILEHLHGNGLHVADSIGDAILTICKLAHQQKIDLGEAIIAKHAYNKSRTYRHGAKLY